MLTIDRAHDAGLRLATRIRTEDPAEAAEAIAGMTHAELASLVVALAESVPVDQPKSALLAWKSAGDIPPPRPLEPCGTPAAAARHRAHHEDVCAACGEAERVYSRDRKRVQRAERRKQQESDRLRGSTNINSGGLS